MLWSELIDRIVKIQQTLPISRLKAILDERDIVNLIMRQDNYLIAMLNKGVMKMNLPGLKTPLLTESLLWNVRYFITNMFDENYAIKESIKRSPNEYVMIYVVLHFVQSAMEIYMVGSTQLLGCSIHFCLSRSVHLFQIYCSTLILNLLISQ